MQTIVDKHPDAHPEMRIGHEQLAAAIRSGSPDEAAHTSDALFEVLADTLGRDGLATPGPTDHPG